MSEKVEFLLAKLKDGDDELAEAAALELAQWGETALPYLETMVSSVNSDERWWAVRTLAEVKSTQATRLIAEKLADTDGSVRQCAALALRSHHSPLTIPALLIGLANPDRLLARLSADALVAIGSEAVPSLIEIMQGNNQTARIEAVRALALIADPRAIPVLFEALSEESLSMDYWANEGLDRMGAGMVYFKP